MLEAAMVLLHFAKIALKIVKVLVTLGIIPIDFESALEKMISGLEGNAEETSVS